MTQVEIQEYLNFICPSKKGTKYADVSKYVSKGVMLQSDIDILCDIVDNGIKNGVVDFDKDLDAIIDVIYRNKYRSSGKTLNTNKPIKSIYPYFIRQVFFFLTVKWLLADDKHVQGDFLNKINDRIEKYVGVREDVSHNFLSELYVTPDMFVKTLQISSPVAPFNYNGQKKDSLAVAIKWLTYQSGKYKGFLDLFGGTSSATQAVPHYDTSLYLYNEKNVFLNNLISVIADDKLYKKLIDRFEKLLKAIKEDDDFLSINDYTDIDPNTGQKLTPDEKLTKEVIEYFNYSRKGKRKKKEKNTVTFDGYGYDYDSIMEFFRLHFIPAIEKIKYDYSEPVITIVKRDKKGKKIAEKEFEVEELYSWRDYTSFIMHSEDIMFIASALSLPFMGNKKYLSDGNEVQEAVWQYTFEDEDYSFEQYRLYKYYAYYANLRRNAPKVKGIVTIPEDNKVEYAVGELLRNNLLTNTNADVSAVLRMRKSTTDAIKLLKKEDDYFKGIIEDMHSKLSVVNCSCEDFSLFFNMKTIIKRIMVKNLVVSKKKKIKLNNPNELLIYSDSPYIGTVGYADREANVKNFTTNDMKTLVNGLVNSGARFIFSCRACKGDDKEANAEIKEHPFEDFIRYSDNNEFYVLVENRALEGEAKKRYELDDVKRLIDEALIQLAPMMKDRDNHDIKGFNNLITRLCTGDETLEVFITNFKIKSFDKAFIEEDYSFTAYTYQEFISILDKCLII